MQTKIVKVPENKKDKACLTLNPEEINSNFTAEKLQTGMVSTFIHLFQTNRYRRVLYVSALTQKKNPTQITFKYLQYAYWPWGICLVNFFFAFFSFFIKIQDGRQNPMAHATA